MTADDDAVQEAEQAIRKADEACRARGERHIAVVADMNPEGFGVDLRIIGGGSTDDADALDTMRRLAVTLLDYVSRKEGNSGAVYSLVGHACGTAQVLVNIPAIWALSDVEGTLDDIARSYPQAMESAFARVPSRN